MGGGFRTRKSAKMAEKAVNQCQRTGDRGQGPGARRQGAALIFFKRCQAQEDDANRWQWFVGRDLRPEAYGRRGGRSERIISGKEFLACRGVRGGRLAHWADAIPSLALQACG